MKDRADITKDIIQEIQNEKEIGAMILEDLAVKSIGGAVVNMTSTLLDANMINISVMMTLITDHVRWIPSSTWIFIWMNFVLFLSRRRRMMFQYGPFSRKAKSKLKNVLIKVSLSRCFDGLRHRFWSTRF